MADYPQHAYATDTSQLPCVPDPALLAAYEIGSASGPPDTTAPTIVVLSSSSLGSREAAIYFVIDDASDLASVFLCARFATLGRTEAIYDGVAFHAPYTASERVGPTFAVRREGGWPADFDFIVGATDDAGNAI